MTGFEPGISGVGSNRSTNGLCNNHHQFVQRIRPHSFTLSQCQPIYEERTHDGLLPIKPASNNGLGFEPTNSSLNANEITANLRHR